MSCNNRNLLLNGGFRKGQKPWRGRNIVLSDNPIYKNDYSMAMGSASEKNPSVLFQVVRGPFASECAYYLYFRVLNRSRQNIQPRLVASVSYIDARGKMLRQTPLLVLPPRMHAHGFKSYFTIVPPPPAATRTALVLFYANIGTVMVDYIRFAAHNV